MALALMGSGNSPKLSGLEPRESNKLKQSILAILAENQKEDPKFSTFIDLIYGFMQAEVDPPVEAIWVYCALKFRTRDCSKHETSERVSAAKDLFLLVSSCSASSSSLRSIVLLAPVLYELQKAGVELFGKDLSSKREKKAMRELNSLLDVILGYISVGSCKESSKGCDAADLNLILPFTDLIGVWTGPNEGLECFFPLLSHGIYDWLRNREFNDSCLAAVVILEAFLLKLCLYFRQGKHRVDLEKELKHWTVGSISGFHNVHFYEALLKLMLEATLPLSSLLKPDEEVLLRKAIFDSIVLVDYPFLHLGGANHLNSECNECLAIERLIVTCEAAEYFRRCDDQNRVIAYLKAFSISPLASHIIKWVASLISLDEKSCKPKGSSPKALIEWLLSLEDRGLQVFNDKTLKCHIKMDLNIQSEAGFKGKMMDDELLLFVDTKGEEGYPDEEVERSEMISAASIGAANMIKAKENRKHKRKAGKSDKRKKNIKFIKYDLSQAPNPDNVRITVDTNSGSNEEDEVEKSLSDEDSDLTD